jgi:solute carrier family 25 folate transporter 32
MISHAFETQTPRGPIGSFTAARLILSTDGLGGFYRGLGLSLLGLAQVAIQFPLYEELKRYFRTDSGSESLGAPQLIAASAISKMVASTTTYPHEVLRARMLNHHGESRMSLAQIAASVLRADGWRGFYVGLGANLMRTVPGCVVNFLTYEFIREKYVAFYSAHKMAS